MRDTAGVSRRAFLAGAAASVAGLVSGVPAQAGKPGGGGLPSLRWKAVPIDLGAPALQVNGMNNNGDLVGTGYPSFADLGEFFFAHSGNGIGQFSQALGPTNDINDTRQYSFDDNSDVGRFNPADGSVTVVNNVNGPYYRIALNNYGDMVFCRDPITGEQGIKTIYYTDATGPAIISGSGFYHTKALNDFGQFCGFITPGNPWSFSQQQIYRFTVGNPSTILTLSNLPGAGLDINSAGDVAGEYWPGLVSQGRQHAYLYTDAAGFKDLGTLGGSYSTAQSLTRRDANGNPYVVGWSTVSSKNGAPNLPFIYNASFGMVDLTKLIDFSQSPGVPSGTLFSPQYINDNLQICAGTNNNLGICLLIPL